MKKVLHLQCLSSVLLIFFTLKVALLKASEDTDFVSFYHEKRNIGLVVEKVTDNNIENWRNFCNTQSSLLDNYRKFVLTKERSQLFFNSYGVMNQSFKEPLGFYDQCDLRIAYALNKKPTQRYSSKDFQDVEMAFLILTSPGVPFQIHMGIHRNLGHLATDKPFTKNLACFLHSYAAFVGQRIWPENIYMVTTPLPTMRDILMRTLPPNSWWEGNLNPNRSDYNERAAIWEAEKGDTYDFILYDKRENISSSPIIFEAHYHQPLWDRTVQNINRAYYEERKEYRWIFGTFHPGTPYFAIDLGKLAAMFE